MRIKRKVPEIASKIIRNGINFFGGSVATQISARLAEILPPTISTQTGSGEIKFFCPGKMAEWRARTLLTKEPETIEWIDTFKETDTFWDIGANVGVYSLYAAIKGHVVLSFEPAPGNYHLLSKNIEINKLDDKILAYCIAFNETTKLDTFFMANTEVGGALNSLGEAIDWQGKPFVASFKQAAICFCIDDFITQFDPPFPNHIKIDVDGIEGKILSGAEKALRDERLKTVLVECDVKRKEYFKKIIESLEIAGLRLSKKEKYQNLGKNQVPKVLNPIFVR